MVDIELLMKRMAEVAPLV